MHYFYHYKEQHMKYKKKLFHSSNFWLERYFSITYYIDVNMISIILFK